MRLKIILTTDWAQDTTDQGAGATWHRKGSMNPLRVSWAEYRGQESLTTKSADELKKMAIAMGPEGLSGLELAESSGGECNYGKFGSAIYLSVSGRLQVWVITDGTNYILATYDSPREPDPTELKEVEEIVGSLALGPEAK